MNPLVSIILPSYNHKEYLKERLDSILNQTFQNFELIMLDDASTDGSQEFLKAYKDHPKVAHSVFNEINTGSPFKQWQRGLELAKGEYVWIAESDDACELNFLASSMEVFGLYSEASIVVAQTFKFTSQKIGGEVYHHIFKESNPTLISQKNINFCPILNVSACIFKNPKLGNGSNEFVNYRLIGDRVFYHEFFYGGLVVKNSNTRSYFRKEGESVSALKFKDSSYLKQYFKEHLRFIDYVYQNTKLPETFYNAYLSKFFKRVRDRMNKKDKLSLTYLLLVIKYKTKLK
ncbi:glycosyltransferase family 2 protein [Psychroflexus tropicus]|uniref:glycosyltransferase family 2 protein n=1 Tax=Psychroflexus tropicus TaxID=197345 RepID=UPI00037F0C3D|nr:glycosyltransferase family 2 protein [Psychroflexus tropicus]